MMLIIYNQDAVEGIEDEAAVDVGVDVDVGDDVDGIEDDYHGAGVDADVCVVVGGDVDVDKDLLPAQMSLLSDVNSGGTSGNP